MIEVVRAGLLTTVQDLGRPGYAHLGVPRSGALDEPALRLANRLVGNPPSAAGLETTLTGACLLTTVSTVVAVTGAAAQVTVDGTRIACGEPVPVDAGARVDIGPASSGVRSYLAFAGGIAVVAVLGSRSTDTLSGLGPVPLRAGMVLPLGLLTGTVLDASVAADPLPRSPLDRSPLEIRVRLGPRDEWLADPAALLATPYQVTVRSNRVAVRLDGAPLARGRDGEIASEGIVLGAVQVPPDGQPLVFLADHPTTGGYPVVAVVERDDLPRLAQARPGELILFVTY